MYEVKIYNPTTEQYELQFQGALSQAKQHIESLGLSLEWDTDAYQLDYVGVWNGKKVTNKY